MPDQSPTPPPARWWVRTAALWAGLILPQVAEYGPSLVGAKILLPLELLATPGLYLPDQPEYRSLPGGNTEHLDKLLVYEPARRFAAAELRAGRYPTWQPYTHAGTPFVIPFFSPFTLMYMAAADPVALAWMQLARAVVAGLGAFLFFRAALGVGFWPAAVGAWSFPLCGYMVFWQGHYLADAAAWLPWALLATDRAVRRPGGLGGAGLGLVIGVNTLTGVPDVTAQLLLASAVYAAFRQLAERGRSVRRAAVPAAVVVVGWVAGLALGACYLVPLSDFARTGARIQERGGGREERPPVGLSALPQVILPYCYGTPADRNVPAYYAPLDFPESAAAGYAGLLAVLAAAPLALADRRHRPAALFWYGVAALGLAWQLDVRGVVDFWRLPGFNLVSHNRDTLLTAFGLTTAAVLGLDAARTGVRWRPAFWLPVAVLVCLGLWSLDRAFNPPAELRDEWQKLRQQPAPGNTQGAKQAAAAADRFAGVSYWGAAVCAAGVGWWVAARRFPTGPAAARLAAGGLLAEVVLSGWGYNSQADPRLYYPPQPVLERLRDAPPGRVLGLRCFPPNLATVVRLSDARGYDAVDPRRYVQLLLAAAEPGWESPPFARTQFFVPKFKVDPATGRATAHPVLNLLGVRYLIVWGRPNPALRPRDQEGGYAVAEFPDALPRAFVPRRAEPAPPAADLLKRLGDDRFDPREVAYVEGLPAATTAGSGLAEITSDEPGRVEIRVTAEAPGVLVLADGWYDGWGAEVNDRPTEVRPAYHTLRAVEVPAGDSTVVFRYDPPAVRTGFRISAAAALVLIGWAGAAWLNRKRAVARKPLAG